MCFDWIVIVATWKTPDSLGMSMLMVSDTLARMFLRYASLQYRTLTGFLWQDSVNMYTRLLYVLWLVEQPYSVLHSEKAKGTCVDTFYSGSICFWTNYPFGELSERKRKSTALKQRRLWLWLRLGEASELWAYALTAYLWSPPIR